VRFSRLKFYRASHPNYGGPRLTKAVAFYPNGFGANVVERDPRFDSYDVEVLISIVPHPKGDSASDAELAYDNPLGDHVFVDQTRDEAEDLLDQIASWPPNTTDPPELDMSYAEYIGDGDIGVYYGALYRGGTWWALAVVDSLDEGFADDLLSEPGYKTKRDALEAAKHAAQKWTDTVEAELRAE